jgi:hypothetical protein
MTTAPDLSGEWHPFTRMVHGTPDGGNYETRKYLYVGSNLPYNNMRHRYESFVGSIASGFKGALLPIMLEVRPISGAAFPMSIDRYADHCKLFEHLPKEQLAVMPMNAILVALRDVLQSHDVINTCKTGEDLIDTASWGNSNLMLALALRDVIAEVSYDDHCSKMYTSANSGWREVWWHLLEDTTFFNNDMSAVSMQSVDKLNVNLQGRRLGRDFSLRTSYNHHLLSPTFLLPPLGV